MATGDKLMTASEIKAVTDTKVDIVNGKGLSTNDYTTAEKEKLQGIAAGAQVNSITGVKGDAESSYRTGNVNLTAANVGASLSVKLTSTDWSDIAAKLSKIPIGQTATFAASSTFSAMLTDGVLNNVSLKGIVFRLDTAKYDFMVMIAGGAGDADIATWRLSNVSDEGVHVETIRKYHREYDVATTTAAGLMSAVDKQKLQGIDEGAQVNAITGVKGDNESTYRTGNINITKADIGLGNVNNTSDADKPVSTAVQAALNLKVNSVSGKGLSTNDFTDAYKAQLDALNATIQSLTSRIQTLEAKNYILYDA